MSPTVLISHEYDTALSALNSLQYGLVYNTVIFQI